MNLWFIWQTKSPCPDIGQFISIEGNDFGDSNGFRTIDHAGDVMVRHDAGHRRADLFALHQVGPHRLAGGPGAGRANPPRYPTTLTGCMLADHLAGPA